MTWPMLWARRLSKLLELLDNCHSHQYLPSITDGPWIQRHVDINNGCDPRPWLIGVLLAIHGPFLCPRPLTSFGYEDLTDDAYALPSKRPPFVIPPIYNDETLAAHNFLCFDPYSVCIAMDSSCFHRKMHNHIDGIHIWTSRTIQIIINLRKLSKHLSIKLAYKIEGKIISKNGMPGLAQTLDIAAHQIPFTSSALTYPIYHTCHYWRFNCRRLSALCFLCRSNFATLYR